MKKENNPIVEDKDINLDPNQDLSLLDKEVNRVKHNVNENDYILEVKNLKMYFPIATSIFKTVPLKAVDNVSFKIRRGETLGLVGESGCGKTTLGRTILQLYNPTSGEILFNGEPVKGKTALKNFRKKATIVFQDPYSSLDPRMTVSDIISEPLVIHNVYRDVVRENRKKYQAEQTRLNEIQKEVSDLKKDKNNIDSSKLAAKEKEYEAQRKVLDDLRPYCHKNTFVRARVEELMEIVGLSKEHASRYVHSFSGGQRQRIGIARALASSPQFIMCDEPVSALDVSIQAQILNTFQDLQQKFGLTYLFVAHNLLVVKHISDRIAVMYLGHIVELANSEELYDNPLHPYTISLLSSIPEPDPIKAKANKRQILEGDIPSPLNAPSGCPFRTRCPKASKECAEKLPELREISKGHFVACRLFDKK